MSLPAEASTAASRAPTPPVPATEEAPASLGLALRRIGPGLILAGAIVGTGELIATTNLGARVGFALLWLVIVSCFIKVFVQVELGRYAISSGEGAFAGFKRLPGPGVFLVWWCVLMIFVSQTQIGAMISGIAQAIQMITPGGGGGGPRSEWGWALVVTLVTIGMLATGSYRLVERVTTVLVAGFTLMTLACVAFLPPEHRITGANLAAGLRFEIPAAAIVAAFTMFGITGVGSNELLAYPYWCIEKGYARHVGPREESSAWATRARGWMRVLRLDAWVSMVVYTIATLAFYLLGAAVLHGQTDGKGLGATQLIETLAAMYQPVLGEQGGRAFIVLGAFCVLYSTLFAATAGSARILADALRVNRWIDPTRKDLHRRWVQVFCALLPSLGFALFLIYGDPVLLVKIGGVMQGVSLPFIAGAAVFLRYRRTDRRLAPGRAWDVLLWLSLIGLTVAAGYTVFNGYEELRRLLLGPG